MNFEKILDDHRKWLRGDGGKRADLSDADLSDADLRGAVTNVYTLMYHLHCPEEGAFIGWKNVEVG